MKTAKNKRPKILKHLCIASKKGKGKGLNKAALTVKYAPLTRGGSSLLIYTLKVGHTVKKKRKRNRKIKALVGKIGWIFFEALVVFFMNYFLFKTLS